MSKGFGSDNHATVHPELMQAILNANLEHAPSYGTDDITFQTIEVMRQHFGQDAEIHFVFNGTAANVLSMAAMTSSFQSVLCSSTAHLNVDECGAPEAIARCKLIPIEHEHGRVKLESIKEHLIRKGDQHFSQPQVISITQPTELGTVYSLDEFRKLIDYSHQQGLYVHVDGARLCNAAVSLGVSLRELIYESKVDVLSFGGTKNGFLFGEAVVFVNSELAKNFKFIKKQFLQLPSKSRFLTAQFKRYFEDDLWKQIATHVNMLAKKLEKGIRENSNLEITHPVESNAVFVKIPSPLAKVLKKKYFFYVWDQNTFEARLMISHDTTEEDINGFLELLKGNI